MTSTKKQIALENWKKDQRCTDCGQIMRGIKHRGLRETCFGCQQLMLALEERENA